MSKEIKLLSPMEAIHAFAKELTTKVRELDELERQWKLGTGQATEILEQMIEAHLYSVFKTMVASNRVRDEDRGAAFKSMALLKKFDFPISMSNLSICDLCGKETDLSTHKCNNLNPNL